MQWGLYWLSQDDNQIIAMTKSVINIGLACGGTGGHISPALALASNFENHDIKPIFITDVRGSSLLKSISHYENGDGQE